jgi:hypothetical protein
MPINVKNPRVILALTVNATATALAFVQPRLIRRAIADGLLPVHVLGNKHLILTSDIEAFVRSLPSPKRKPKRSPDV